MLLKRKDVLSLTHFENEVIFLCKLFLLIYIYEYALLGSDKRFTGVCSWVCFLPQCADTCSYYFLLKFYYYCIIPLFVVGHEWVNFLFVVLKYWISKQLTPIKNFSLTLFLNCFSQISPTSLVHTISFTRLISASLSLISFRSPRSMHTFRQKHRAHIAYHLQLSWIKSSFMWAFHIFFYSGHPASTNTCIQFAVL